MLIKVMSKWVQSILQQPGDDCDSPYIVRAAPTGMAAANVEGSTLHSAFNFNFGYNFIPLSDKNRDMFEGVVREIDINGDGKIDFNEFRQMLVRLANEGHSTSA